jgi:hypothetical protein
MPPGDNPTGRVPDDGAEPEPEASRKGMEAMNDQQTDRQMLYRLLYPPEEQDQTRATPPSLLPWLGYALLGLLTVISLTTGLLALLSIG